MPPDFAMKSEQEIKKKLKQEIKPKKSLMMTMSESVKNLQKRLEQHFITVSRPRMQV